MAFKYRIFDYTWHIPHQYDLVHALKEECDFDFCLNIKTDWNETVRPRPLNINFVANYEPGKYDLAILHVDQSSILNNNKRLIYEQFDKVITDIPKVVLNHGSPVFPEVFPPEMSLRETEVACIEEIKGLVGEKMMIVNSYTAASHTEWGFGVPIVHGMNPEEWWDLPKEPRVFSALSPNGLNTYYNRECLIEVSEILRVSYGYPFSLAKVNVDTSKSYEDYKSYLGKSLLYLDTSFRTPMNRARTEAFLSGCCVIQVEGAHDLERWGVHNENIVIVPNDPDEIAKIIVYYLEEGFQEALKIGQKGKELARTHFCPSRYRQDWLQILNDVCRTGTKS